MLTWSPQFGHLPVTIFSVLILEHEYRLCNLKFRTTPYFRMLSITSLRSSKFNATSAISGSICKPDMF